MDMQATPRSRQTPPTDITKSDLAPSYRISVNKKRLQTQSPKTITIPHLQKITDQITAPADKYHISGRAPARRLLQSRTHIRHNYTLQPRPGSRTRQLTGIETARHGGTCKYIFGLTRQKRQYPRQILVGHYPEYYEQSVECPLRPQLLYLRDHLTYAGLIMTGIAHR